MKRGPKPRQVTQDLLEQIEHHAARGLSQKQICDALGFSETKTTSQFRSTRITAMLTAGGKLDFVSRIAGHANVQTTLNHYVRPENFDLQDTMNLLSTPPENAYVGRM